MCRFFIAFLPSKEQVCFNFVAADKVHSDFRAQENKICHSFHFSIIYMPWSGGTGCHKYYLFVNSFLNVEFKLVFSSPLLIARLFSFSLLSAIRVVSSSYLWMLILLPAILIPAWDLSRPAYWMMYLTYRLNNQSDNVYLVMLLSQF